MFVGDPKKKQSYDLRDQYGRSIGRDPTACGPPVQEAWDLADSVEEQISAMGGMGISSFDIGRGGAGITTYGWKMFEEEERDRILREKDFRQLLEKLLGSLRGIAQTDEGAVSGILRSHPNLSAALSQSAPLPLGSLGG